MKDTNTGYRNSGNWNSGDRNSGDRNSGYRNSGNWNSGYRNSGNWNSGDRNSGYRNSGNWNSGDRNSGYFNVDAPNVRMFGVDTGIGFDDWEVEFPDYMFFDLCEWIDKDDMTKEEKKDNPGCKTTGGYLKTLGYKEAWRKAWDGASDEEKVQTIELPNFDADIFEEITGIDVRRERFEGNTFCEKDTEDDKTEEAMELLRSKGYKIVKD